MSKWKTGDWIVFERSIVQIKEDRGEGSFSVSDGWFEMSGQLSNRFRELTLRNKRIVEWFENYYKLLSNIPGEAGFNYPEIHSHFTRLCLQAIDDEEDKSSYDAANDFVNEACEYTPIIQGINLFRQKLQ
jgi:hypothetical protein